MRLGTLQACQAVQLSLVGLRVQVVQESDQSNNVFQAQRLLIFETGCNRPAVDQPHARRCNCQPEPACATARHCVSMQPAAPSCPCVPHVPPPPLARCVELHHSPSVSDIRGGMCARRQGRRSFVRGRMDLIPVERLCPVVPMCVSAARERVGICGMFACGLSLMSVVARVARVSAFVCMCRCASLSWRSRVSSALRVSSPHQRLTVTRVTRHADVRGAMCAARACVPLRVVPKIARCEHAVLFRLLFQF